MYKMPLQAAALMFMGALPAIADTDLGIIGADLRLGYSNQMIEGASFPAPSMWRSPITTVHSSICNTKSAAMAASDALGQ
ncbi:hypothetical protein [Sulfitobacter sediminilitoris]|uniref:hypothetical protein n=1 Tax=Sulfitobacter sediminilitoris TaxID=2698830 RepID=UPI0036177F85